MGTAITDRACRDRPVKGYQTLVGPDIKLDVNTAMIATGCARALLDTRARQPEIADILAKMN